MASRLENFTTQGSVESKQPMRDQIARETAEFEARGGKIEILAPPTVRDGYCSPVTYNP